MATGRETLRRTWLCALGGVVSLLVAAAPAPAQTTVGTVQAEGMRHSAGSWVVADRAAGRRRALVMYPQARAAARFRIPSAGQLGLRARKIGTCQPRLRVSVDGRRAFSARLGRRTYATTKVLMPLGAGGHTLRISVGGRGASCAVVFDRVTFIEPAIRLGTAVRVDAVLSSARYRRAFARDFDSLTPENELKMERVEPRRGVFNFLPADKVIELAMTNRKRVRGHTLVFGAQLPAWVTDPEEPWTRAELLDVLRDYISTVVRRYRGRIDQWDVINEVLAPGGFQENVWYRTIGPSYIDEAFRAARAADPGAKLFLNDALQSPNDPRLNQIVSLVRALKQRGVPIDGVGLQQHTDVRSQPTQEQVTLQINTLAQLGVEVAITEMDVDTSPGNFALDFRIRAQTAAYRASAKACRLHPACTSFTVWGVADHWSWRGVQNAPLLLTPRYRAKPAYRAVRRELARR